MGMQSTAKRRRKQAKQDARYAPKASMSSERILWKKQQAAKKGRSYGYQG